MSVFEIEDGARDLFQDMFLPGALSAPALRGLSSDVWTLHPKKNKEI